MIDVIVIDGFENFIVFGDITQCAMKKAMISVGNEFARSLEKHSLDVALANEQNRMKNDARLKETNVAFRFIDLSRKVNVMGMTHVDIFCSSDQSGEMTKRRGEHSFDC
jgi:hypothetical protein